MELEEILSRNWTDPPLVLNETLDSKKNDTSVSYPSFSDHSMKVVIVYCALFLVAAAGNLTVFISLFRSRHRKSRISLMIRHLAIADLVVTFFMIPLEVGWRITVQWLAGNFACKAFLFLRAFGLYLSSNVLICVSLDRYFAVLHPLKVNDARRRGKIMLAFAWSMSLIYSIPQSVVFHLSPHPNYPAFFQCVTFGFFVSRNHEIAYNLFCVLAMYFIPLMVIVGAYSAIMWEISSKSKESAVDSYQTSNGRMHLRRSDISNIERARIRTLRMTITIVVVFVICWTPYVVMTLWYMFDRNSAEQVPSWLQDTLFMMAVANSCMNPLVYGSYAINFRKELSRCCCCCCHTNSPEHRPKGQRITAGQGVRLPKKLLKCGRALQAAAGSGATRSTAMIHGVITNKSQTNRPENHYEGLLPKKTDRPPSVGQISFVSENSSTKGYHRPSFHSEPGPCSDRMEDICKATRHKSEASVPTEPL